MSFNMKFCNTTLSGIYFISLSPWWLHSLQFKRRFESCSNWRDRFARWRVLCFLYPFVAVENFCSYTCTKAMSNCKNQRPINSKTL